MDILGHINLGDFKQRFVKEAMSELIDYLDPELVTFLDANTQLDALQSLVELLDSQNKLQDKEAFFQAILQREKIVSTGIGIGVAIPHAKMEEYDEFFIAIGIQKGDGVEWSSLDGLPVKLIFLIGGPEKKQAEYLNILSMITTAVKEEKRRQALLSAKNAEEVIEIFEQY